MSEQKYPIKGGFFNSINGDRKYNAEDMNKPYTRIIAEGIFATPEGTPSTDLQVLSADKGMNIIVKSGSGLLGRKWFENTSDIAITISNNTSIVPRIDSIILQIDKTQSGRIANIVYREGIASSNPMHQSINTEENIFELRLADILISPSCVKVTQDLITDCRGSEECPWITSLIKQVDTSTLFLQWQTAYKKYFTESTEAFNTFFNTYQEWVNSTEEQTEADLQKLKDDFNSLYQNYYDESTAEFQQWFDTIKGKLSGDIATSLQQQVDELKKKEIVISETEPDQDCIWYKVLNTTQQEETTYELKTKAYDENEKFHLEQDNQLETIINVTDDMTDTENIIIEEI